MSEPSSQAFVACLLACLLAGYNSCMEDASLMPGPPRHHLYIWRSRDAT